MVIGARTLAGFVLALLVSADTAMAQKAGDTVRRWGLVGTWALDCGKPASSSNGYLSYAADAAGKASHNRDFGDRKDVNTVEQARVGTGGALELTVSFPGLSQTRKYTMIMGMDGRIRAKSNSKADGTEPTITNGKFTSNSQDTPWQTRCR